MYMTKSKYKLSILICSLWERGEHLNKLLDRITGKPRQEELGIEILVNVDDRQSTTGKKRQQLLERATGDYICFIDDDDDISDTYIESVLDAIKTGPDAVGITVEMTTNGGQLCMAYCSIETAKWFQTTVESKTTYYRSINHLCPVKRELALMAGFPDKTIAEDSTYAYDLHPYLSNQVVIPETIYYYKFVTGKNCGIRKTGDIQQKVFRYTL